LFNVHKEIDCFPTKILPLLGYPSSAGGIK
jgi:hypothetical protein